MFVQIKKNIEVSIGNGTEHNERITIYGEADENPDCSTTGDLILIIADLTIGKGFFNDTYLMDQNACSSPQLIIWLGKKNKIAKEKFWSTIFKIAKKEYNLKTISVLDKYTQICNDSIDLEEIGDFKNFSNILYTVSLSRLPKNILTLRGNCGYFYEYNITDLNSLANIVSNKFQTLTYYGLNKPDIINFIVKNRLSGIDRVVPIGKALDIGVFWDGYDILGSLTRIIDVV